MITHFTRGQKGIAIGFLGYTGFAMADVAGKWVAETGYPPWQILCIEAFVACCVLALFAGKLGGWTGWNSRRDIQYHTYRIFLNIGLNLLLVFSFTLLSLAHIYAMVFAKPFWAVLLAILFFGEKVCVNRWIAIVLGFAGVLVVLQPDPAAMRLELLIPLLASFLVAVFFIMSRALKDASPLVMTFYPMAGSFLLTLPVVIATFQPVPMDHIPVFLAGGSFLGFGVLCLSNAFRMAPASLVSPFLYTEMIWGLLFGFLIFGDLPDTWMLAGTAIIVVSGLYLMMVEKLNKKDEVTVS